MSPKQPPDEKAFLTRFIRKHAGKIAAMVIVTPGIALGVWRCWGPVSAWLAKVEKTAQQVEELKGDVAGVKSDVGAMKTDVAYIRGRLDATAQAARHVAMGVSP